MFHKLIGNTGNQIENVTAQFDLQQIIKEPTHISNTSSFCVDLIFTSQPNLITDSGVHSLLHSNCHHQIVFGKFNLHIGYPHPSYVRSGSTEKQTQGLLEVPSNNLIGKKHFQAQILIKKVIFLIELFLIFLVTLFHMKQLYVMTKIHPGSTIE